MNYKKTYNRPINKARAQGKEFSLSELKDGELAVIVSVPNHSLFAPLGIRELKTIFVESKHPFSGPLLINVDGRQIAVSRHLARDIRVKNCLEECG